MTVRVIVIGNGGFAMRCLDLVRSSGRIAIPLVIADPNAQALHGVLEKYCERAGLPLLHAPKINEPNVLDAVRAARADYVLNAYNMQVFGRTLLSIPKHGAINFHNGPLPRYRGLNVYSWAIINGEIEYGVTWHVMDDTIDGGDILAQKMFSIDAKDTPTSLVRKGFDAGVEALADLLQQIGAGSLRRVKQDARLATYYSRKDVPNGGHLDFAWTFDRLERFTRGLDFRPLKNSFVRATASFGHHRFHPQTIRLVERSCGLALGAVVKITETGIETQAADAIVELADLLDADLRPAHPQQLAAALGIGERSVLDGPGH